MSNNEYGNQGTQTIDSSATGFNAVSFIAQMLINGMATATLVKVVSSTNNGGLSPVGLVDIQPLINQVDGFGNAIPHSIIHNCPYLRLQGGSNAIILDPVAGDTGIAIFSDKDMSKVVNAQLANGGSTASQANPDSARRFSFADGLYLGGVLNGTPVQYIRYSESGITITSTTEVIINAPVITLNGAVTATSTLDVTTSVTSPLVSGTTDVIFGGKSAGTHTHGGVEEGSGHTDGPD